MNFFAAEMQVETLFAFDSSLVLTQTVFPAQQCF